MKVTIENQKGLLKDLRVFIDKETINSYMDEKYEEIKENVNLKGFRKGKVPKKILKNLYGESIFNEILNKVVKETTTKALEENKINPLGQPKVELKVHGIDKDLEYVISVTEFPKVELKPIEDIKFDEYLVKIDNEETDKRINEIAKKQKNYKSVADNISAKKDNLVIFDYNATIDEKKFKGGEGKNIEIVLGNDLFIKGFDKQLIGVKKNDTKIVDVELPENYPQKEFANKKAKFNCKIIAVKDSVDVKINDELAKNLGAKDLTDLKSIISKQINDEYKNSLDELSKKQILKELDKFKIGDIPEKLINDEVKILSENMSEEDRKINEEKLKISAEKKIKVALILNELGRLNKITVLEQDIQSEIQKQMGMMPGQEKMVMNYYQKNESAIESLRGVIYEQKIIDFIKTKAKSTKKELSKDDAEIKLKEYHNYELGNLKQTKNTPDSKKHPKTKKLKKVSKKKSQTV